MGNAGFDGKILPWLLMAPQLLILAFFFFWPAAQALFQSFSLVDAFGGDSVFVGLENFTYILSSSSYQKSFSITIVFNFLVVFWSLFFGLLFAVAVNNVFRSKLIYRTLLIWPYAVAPAIAGTLWLFLLNPTSGYVSHILNDILGLGWDPTLKPWHGMAFVVIASVWKQVSYNFIFFFAGLQAIPRSLIDASIMDGATPFFRFRTIVIPLLAPMTFFLVVMNTIYAFFDTFGAIASTTDGGPQAFTKTLVYKVYEDGFIGNDLGGSAAQSVILMILVIALTVAQFKYVERRINYGV